MEYIKELLENRQTVTLIYISVILLITIIVKIILKKKNIKESFTIWTFISLTIIFALTHYAEKEFMVTPLIRIQSLVINLRFILITLLSLILASKLSQFLILTVFRRVYDRYDVNANLRFTFNSTLKMILMFIAIMVALNALGLSLNSLAVFSSVLGVGLAFGLQNITANFISGIILMFGAHVKIGDRIKLKGEVVDVQRIGFRATIVNSIEDKSIIVPNSYFLENMVENLTHGSGIIRLTLPVGVAYNSDMNFVEKLLIDVAHEMAEEYDSIILEPKPFVYFKSFGDSALDLELFLWTNDPKKVIKLRSAANFKIYDIFNKNNIEIPFPQMDIYNRES